RDIERNPGASMEALQALTMAVGSALPAEYLDWMKSSNGGEGFLGSVSYLMLWPVEEILERNRRLQVPPRMPGFVLFASNGGDAAYAFDTRSSAASQLPISQLPIVEIPYIDIGKEGAALDRGRGFHAFLEGLAASL